jgi:hypothetical protein
MHTATTDTPLKKHILKQTRIYANYGVNLAEVSPIDCFWLLAPCSGRYNLLLMYHQVALRAQKWGSRFHIFYFIPFQILAVVALFVLFLNAEFLF